MSPATSHAQQNLRGILLRSAGMIAFALMSAAMKWASEEGARAIEMLFFRSLVGIPVVLIWLATGPGIGTIRTKRPGAHLFRSLLGLGSLAMIFQALILLPIADAVTIGFSSPAFATILSALLLREHVGRHRWSAVLLGFVGVLLVARPGGAILSHAGIAFALFGALGAGAATVTIREMGARETPGSISFWFFVFTALVSSIGMIFVAQPHPPTTWALLLFGGLAGGLAQVLMVSSLKVAPVSAVAPFDYTQIVWATLLGWLIWSTLPTLNTLLGAALIIASGLYTAWREHRLHKNAIPATPPGE